MSAVALEVRNVIKTFNIEGGGTINAVDDVSFEINRNEFFAFQLGIYANGDGSIFCAGPDGPVTTVTARCGMLREMPFRLCWRAPVLKNWNC